MMILNNGRRMREEVKEEIDDEVFVWLRSSNWHSEDKCMVTLSHGIILGHAPFLGRTSLCFFFNSV